MTKYIFLNDLKAYGQVDLTNTGDDSVLTASIDRAEMEIDGHCGQQFDEQTLTLATARQPFIDGNGWLWLSSVERSPVTAVTAVQIRDLRGSNTWQVLTWQADDLILPIFSAPPDANSGKVRILATNPVLSPRSTGSLMARWSYKGGYNAIPSSLKAMTMRLAWWIYKLREAPLGRVATLELGIMEIPLSMPKDILHDLNLWRRINS